MPLSVRNAEPKVVMPLFLSRSFRHSRTILCQENHYNDGSRQVGLRVSTSRKSFEARFVGNAAALTAMREFWVARHYGTEEFYFYYSLETIPKFYYSDSISGQSEGRYSVIFADSEWAQTIGIARCEVDIRLIEIN